MHCSPEVVKRLNVPLISGQDGMFLQQTEASALISEQQGAVGGVTLLGRLQLILLCRNFKLSASADTLDGQALMGTTPPSDITPSTPSHDRPGTPVAHSWTLSLVPEEENKRTNAKTNLQLEALRERKPLPSLHPFI